MSDSVTRLQLCNTNEFAQQALRLSAQLWFLVASFGQGIFLYYLVAYYVVPALQGGLVAWTDSRLVTGYVAGDTVGNMAVATHIFLAFVIINFGPLQLLPQIRSKFPTLHRWTGRIYMGAVVATSFAGLYMVWGRGNSQAGIIEHIGTSIGAVLIIFFAFLALRNALSRNFTAHRKWALRLFIVVSGVWFIRLGYGLWFLWGTDAVGAQKIFSIFISYAQYLLPLAMLELYFFAQERSRLRTRLVLTAGLLLATIFTSIGIFMAATVMWLPRL